MKYLCRLLGNLVCCRFCSYHVALPSGEHAAQVLCLINRISHSGFGSNVPHCAFNQKCQDWDFVDTVVQTVKPRQLASDLYFFSNGNHVSMALPSHVCFLCCLLTSCFTFLSKMKLWLLRIAVCDPDLVCCFKELSQRHLTFLFLFT